MLIMGMAVACLLASCKKENDNESKDATYFKASIEQGNGDSKTYLDPDGNMGYVKWSVGDQFKLAESTGSATATFTLVEGEEGKAQSAEFICHGFILEPSYTAAYPADNISAISSGTVTFDLPATQNITATGTFGNGASPMVAAGDGPELSFKNVCGGLGFPLKGAGVHVTGLRLTSNKTTDKLWGTFTVANCTETEPTLTYGTGGSNVIQLVCDVDLTADAQWFYVMLPPGTLTDGFTLEVLNGNNVVFTQSTPNNPNMVRNVIRGINSDINLDTTPEGAISGKFTINSSGDKVYFSQGNLQWSGVNGWRFAEHQYVYISDAVNNNSPTTSDGNYMDLFCWGATGKNGVAPNTNNSYLTGEADLSGDNDWGSNDIKAGETTIPAGTYRTLTIGEWEYIINNHTKGWSTVAGVGGYVIRPDGVETAVASSYAAEAWATEEAAGSVFLPAAGNRDGTWVSSAGSFGYYWSSSYNDSYYARNVYFISGYLSTGSNYRYLGFSVRLVRSAQ